MTGHVNDTSVLPSLIERLEKATGPSIELDEEIRVAVSAERINFGAGEGLVSDESCYGPPSYTDSIDAALSLLPPRFFWRIDSHDPVAWVYRNLQDAHNSGLLAPYPATPAIAICIAALKATGATR